MQYQTQRANKMLKHHEKEERALSLNSQHFMRVGVLYQNLCVKIRINHSPTYSRQVSSGNLLK